MYGSMPCTYLFVIAKAEKSIVRNSLSGMQVRKLILAIPLA